MAKKGASEVDITPDVGVLSLFPALKYKAWYAMGEFVDNALQSYLTSRSAIEKTDGKGTALTVEIETELGGEGRIVIRDSAAGIALEEFARAFRPAKPPPDKGGLSEFGIGMKSAACWFARRWSVRTKALGEPVEREVKFDVQAIVETLTSRLAVTEKKAPEADHYTEIVLEGLHQRLQGRTEAKVREHLSSIYRVFLRDGTLRLRYNGDWLSFPEPMFLKAAHHKEKGEAKLWRKNIHIRLSGPVEITGTAGLLEKASTSHAGFALFRRGRLIEGSADDTYRPREIFGSPNSFAYQRLYGELNVEGLDVTHTKDGFNWNGVEEEFLAKLEAALDANPLRLLDQARNYRAKLTKADLKPAAEKAIDSTVRAMEDGAAAILSPEPLVAREDVPKRLPPAESVTERDVTLEHKGVEWKVHVEFTSSRSVADWLTVAERRGPIPDDRNRELSIRVSLVHPFVEQFVGPRLEQLEPIVRLAVALALAEEHARNTGEKVYPAEVRRKLNDLLKEAFWKT